jgi:hypothetical protein
LKIKNESILKKQKSKKKSKTRESGLGHEAEAAASTSLDKNWAQFRVAAFPRIGHYCH